MRALLLAATALPGMAMAIGDDALREASGLTHGDATALSPVATDSPADDASEFGMQISRYQEGSRTGWQVQQVGTIAPSAGSSVSGVIYAPERVPSPPSIRADGLHVYGRARLGDRLRGGFDFAQDVWSGASPIASLPSNFRASASPSSSSGGYFDANGVPQFQSKYQGSAAAGSGPTASPQILQMVADPHVTHAMGFASPETRRQGTARLGYDFEDFAVDGGLGLSDEPDFAAHFGNLSVRRDFDDKRTSVSAGLSFTRGDTHAQWVSDGYWWMRRDAYPGGFPGVTSMIMTRFVQGVPSVVHYLSPVVGGTRSDLSLTGGVTRVAPRDDLLSTGFGYTYTHGFLSNPWKGSLVLFPGSPDPFVLARYPGISYWQGGEELEHRPSLRQQFTWDSTWTHYFANHDAALQLHYGLFLDSWGIHAQTFEGEWRQNLGQAWTVTPRLRYYTQSAANFYATWFFAPSAGVLPAHNFSSDDRLSAYGTINPSLSLQHQLMRGLTAELGWELSRRSGSLRLGGQGAGSFADLQSNTLSVSLRGNLEALDSLGAGSGNSVHHHHEHGGDAPAGVMDAHLMGDAGAFMVDLSASQMRQSSALRQGSSIIAPSQTGYRTRTMGGQMTMEMLGIMYAPSANWQWMLMPQMVDQTMNMIMITSNSGGSMAYMDVPMRSFMANGGVGDTVLSASARLPDLIGHHLHATLGLSIPTGSIHGQPELGGNAGAYYAPDMQLGSGTWDLLPSVTASAASGRFSWGAQAAATIRPGTNSQGYALGNETRSTAWVSWQPIASLTGSLRILHADDGLLRGAVPLQQPTQDYSTPDYARGNYGGHNTDLGLGLSWRGSARYAAQHLGVEWLAPVHTQVNGIQPDRIGTLWLRAQLSF